MVINFMSKCRDPTQTLPHDVLVRRLKVDYCAFMSCTKSGSPEAQSHNGHGCSKMLGIDVFIATLCRLWR